MLPKEVIRVANIFTIGCDRPSKVTCSFTQSRLGPVYAVLEHKVDSSSSRDMMGFFFANSFVSAFTRALVESIRYFTSVN